MNETAHDRRVQLTAADLKVGRRRKREQAALIKKLLKPAARRMAALGWPEGFTARVWPKPMRTPFKLVQLLGEPFEESRRQSPLGWVDYVRQHMSDSLWLGQDGQLYALNPRLMTEPWWSTRAYVQIPIKEYADRHPEAVIEKLTAILETAA